MNIKTVQKKKKGKDRHNRSSTIGSSSALILGRHELTRSTSVQFGSLIRQRSELRLELVRRHHLLLTDLRLNLLHINRHFSTQSEGTATPALISVS
ncbi:unnamed protein product [Microthlaspi erraticum]|uniref:Uncharacterized protein n=1 Tax=Microthlaspi erraticum TaxID=1685480 RepID=A0A6D2IS44_9BRAS|nr:unnamed protein product [Microthlaspi erraticum]